MKKNKIIGIFMLLIILTSILPVSAFSENDVNDYVKEVSSFIDEKCHGDCEDIIILGDDYVIPHYRKDFYIENGWNFLGWKFGREYEHPIMLTDDLYIQKQNDFDIADLQYVFSELKDGQFRYKPIVMIVPDDMDENFTTAATQLKHAIGQQFSPNIEVLRSNEVQCDDLNHFNSLEDAALVIVGTEETNHAFNCYPVIEPLEDSMYIDINVWDPDHNSLIIKTNDSNTLSFYSMFIYFEQYKSVHAPRMTVIDKVVLASGAVMIVVGVGLTVSGFGSAIGVPLAAAGFALDAASITNECWIENGGGRNWNGCYLDVGVTIGSFGIGRWIIGPLFKKLGTHLAVKRIVQNLDELGEHIPHRVLNDVLRNSDDAGELAIRLSKGVDALKSKNIPLEDLFKQSSRSIDDVKRLNIILNIGDLFTRNSEFAEKALMGMSRYNNLEKMVLLSRINEIDTAFNLGSGYIEEIRFVSYLPEGTLGRTLEGVIEINVKANFDEIVGNVISHEYGHNYITKKLGGKQIWDFMGNPAGSRQYLESFDEFLTEKTARDIFDLHIHSDLLKNADDVSKFRFYYLEIFSSPDPAKRLSVANKMVEMLAVSKYHDPLRYDFMLDALEDGTELSHKIIYASEAYADAANIITETNKRQILTGIQNHVMDIEEITKRIIVRNE